jgi:hypothetical protein
METKDQRVFKDQKEIQVLELKDYLETLEIKDQKDRKDQWEIEDQ